LGKKSRKIDFQEGVKVFLGSVGEWQKSGRRATRDCSRSTEYLYFKYLF